MSETEIFSVSGITRLIKETLEDSFFNVKIVGEISNFKAHVSGHWYFTLKDSEAQISCTMWKGINNFVFFSPCDGMKVVVTGKITVYPPRGNYQLDVRSMRPQGVGELQTAFEILKERLMKEGLFDEEIKKPLPEYPSKIGIVTAIDGAALKDMLSVAERRFPALEIIIAHARVQGTGAAESISEAIKILNELNDLDLIIIARGGGSIEDLWAFNEEIVARSIFKSKIPIVTGIGHQVDFTIADFVADVRAATPTAAMELATPEINETISFVQKLVSESTFRIENLIDDNTKQIRNLLNSYSFRIPEDLVKKYNQSLDHFIYRISNEIDNEYQYSKNKIELLISKLELNNIDRTLKKGFVLVRQEDKFVKRAKDFLQKKPFSLQFYDNKLNISD
jgi:exodeoxyribonuclease VII large subunit